MVVAPDFSDAKATKTLPLNAVVTPRTRNTLETGVGYSTDVGPRIKANWKKPWVNDRGQSIESTINLSGRSSRWT
ncbi:Uncharacterised protein [Ewingella americana]|uniref:Uncharacterized protein n=1 Tax=Ewingella americana TaxID=41202 RepID=A0A377NIB8_9GAMM|nr:Uncharacterised protein [Ewingella americana]